MTRATTAVSGLWKAPAQDGQLLLWPDPQTLLKQVAENSRLLSQAHGVLIQNVPLAELRKKQRQWIGHDDARPLIATAHQIELLHPGVWAKDVFINSLARRVGGEGYYFAVDTDAPKHLTLRWPRGEKTGPGAYPITDDPDMTSADWAGLLSAPSPAHLAEIERALAVPSRGWGFEPMVPRVLDAMKRLTLESSCLTWVLVNAVHQLEWELGLRHHALLVSPIWISPPYFAFVHHLLARADQFASIYNTTLADYRREQGIKDAGRPWPDLKREDAGDEESCEAPFWLDDLAGGQRRRAKVVRSRDGWALRINDAQFVLDPNRDGWTAADDLARFLSSVNCRLSPRALTLTMFLRLFMADQFVHGIGGARYDHVTNRIIERWLGLAAPAFSVTTATLLFPTATRQPRADLVPLHQEGRRLRHGDHEPWKRELLSKIAELPRRSMERERVFYEMHQKLDSLAKSDRQRQWEARLQSARKVAAEQLDRFDRELFFALQPRERLQNLIDQYEQRLQS